MKESFPSTVSLTCIELICKFYSIDVDTEGLKNKYFIEDRLTLEEILRIFKDFGFKVGYKKFRDLQEVKKYPLPAIVILYDENLAAVLGIKDEKVLYFDCKQKKVFEVSTEEFDKIWENEAIVLYPKFKATIFYLNLKWLFSEFFKYKSIFSQIVLSSAFIQIFALITTTFYSNYS